MTCVIALKTDKGVYIAADHALSGGSLTSSKIKIYKSGITVGFAGSLSFQNDMSLEEEIFLNPLTNDIIDNIWKQVKRIAPANDEQRTGEMLITDGTKIVYLGNVAGTFTSLTEFNCAGSGAQIATGAMAALKNEQDAETRIIKSLDIVAQHSTNVKSAPNGLYTVEFIKNET